MFMSTDARTPDEYIDRLEEPRRTYIRELHGLIRTNAPKLEPHLASGMLAYGPYEYRGKSGSGTWFRLGLASQKRYISLYVMAEDLVTGGYLAESYKDRLPKANIGKSCLRFKRPEDLDRATLTKLIKEAATLKPLGQA
ncbi:MAG TPA: DUF1801 domain-containing protein [Candidatus Limnocylindria bacterium]|nr:DUF1801 domain-containing protein [Candidatus Limnocylindria bacterium]